MSFWFLYRVANCNALSLWDKQTNTAKHS